MQVRDYIRENDSASIQQISDDNEVSVKQIKQWIREERLIFTDKSPVGIECETCGAMIRTGRYCNKCKESMASNLKQMYVMPPQEDQGIRGKDKDRMHFLDKG
jgi:methionyl-tRNA synthetase